MKDKIMCLCPFHEEKTESCSVDLSDKTFHCFGCGEKGDISKLVKKWNEVVTILNLTSKNKA